MSWLDWKPPASSEETAAQPPRRAAATAKPTIIDFWITVQPSSQTDPGECVPGWYFVEDDTLVMCDQKGRPTGKTHKLRKGDNAQQLAGSFRRSAWLMTDAAKPFNRPLRYGPLAIA